MDTALLALQIGLLTLAFAAWAAADDDAPLDAERVEEIAQMLPEQPEGLGQPITDREAWQRLGETEAYQTVVERAEGLLGESLPEQPDDLYLDFSRTGNRTRWQRVASQRRGRLAPLVLAECVEDQGRFLPAIKELIGAICAERTWVMPAHDRSLANFNQERVDIDLASSALAWNMATASWLLANRLSEDTRRLIAENVERRVLTPFEDMFTGEREHNWWMHTTNNWNAVCLAGVTGAGLAQIDDRHRRAEFVAAAEKYSMNFLRGFTEDGYCSEGLGYWNYGYGNYVLLADTVWQATDGGLDLLAREQARQPALFGARIQIIGGVAPAFADCSINARPSNDTMWYLNRRFGMGLEEYDELPLSRTLGSLSSAMIFSFPNGATEGPQLEAADARPGIRTWFDEAGVLIGRPAEGGECRMGVALKGGHNAEHHNHNDVGSYVVVVEDRAVLLDPGSEVYTARTFSSRRYESKLLNSYGHPVPVVAGELQRTGREAAAQVLEAEFTDDRDRLVLDLAPAYEVPELQTLQRTFEYSRGADCSLTVTDRVEFAQPSEFEVPLLTDGDWLQRDEDTVVAWEVDRAVQVQISVEGADFAVEADEIHEDARAQPTRIAIRLTEPVRSATVTAIITPIEDLGGEEEGMLANGGFEHGSWAWSIPDDGIAQVSEEMAASGKRSLRITDESEEAGSSVTSARMPVDAPGSYVLSGQVYHVSGEGIGLYVRIYDEDGAMLNPRDERGYIDPVGSLSGEPGRWESFEYEFEIPENAAAMDLWIHSYNAAVVEAYVDELKIAPIADE
ncbi:MAG: heparinase II/III family protein [Armatimonadota bacterium]|nr:heparinase II/III family protein [Armatimonadota bacterium]